MTGNGYSTCCLHVALRCHHGSSDACIGGDKVTVHNPNSAQYCLEWFRILGGRSSLGTICPNVFTALLLGRKIVVHGEPKLAELEATQSRMGLVPK